MTVSVVMLGSTLCVVCLYPRHEATQSVKTNVPTQSVRNEGNREVN